MSDDGVPPPKGVLVAIGGNERKEKDSQVLRTIVDLPEGGTRVVEVIPTASSIPEEVAETYVEAFGDVGVDTVRVMNIQSREEADRSEYVARLREADVVFLTGGDQLRITSLLGGSAVLDAIKGHYRRGGVVAGTSAGAAAMSETMISEGGVANSMRKGNVHMTPGLGLVRMAVIDTHFIDRGRVGRLLEVVASNPGLVGVGLGENTGVVIHDGSCVRAFGGGVVVIVEGHRIRHTNISDIRMGEPIAVENILLHALVDDYEYDLVEQRYMAPPQARAAKWGGEDE